MTLLSLVLVYVIEQLRPLPSDNAVQAAAARWFDNLVRQFNVGERRQGLIAWLLAVVPWVIGVLLVYKVLGSASWVLVLAFNVAVLYFLIGFRQISNSFTAVLEALRNDDIDAARAAFAGWRNKTADSLDSSEIAKLAIEEGLTAAHRRVFGVIFWFIVIPGPVGAVLYGLAAMLNDRWGRHGGEELVEFGSFARQAFKVLDWIPSRLTALTFAIVGDFEDAIFCWRTQSNSWGNLEQGIVLAAGAGALGVRLGEAVHEDGTVTFRPELGLGEQPGVDHMVSGIWLVWRSVLIWLFVIALVTLAVWFD